MERRAQVFISYARSDGSEYARWLREKIRNEHPDIGLWQDVTNERAGHDWWLQVTDALDHVQSMVLVATPGAMKSDTVTNEWRYARQRGVCILPVLGSHKLEIPSLPRWMRTKHIADLEMSSQWDLFVADLHRPCESPRVPFMADDLPRSFVPRPAEYEALLQLLLDDQREQNHPLVAKCAALVGAGGFGKTSLARAICHDERIQELFDDGILWVTLGNEPTSLHEKILDLVAVLSGERTQLTSLETAVSRLRELLDQRDILMVIDDAWKRVHLEPFMQGGSRCVRLITTRNVRVLPQGLPCVAVDAMKPDESICLLTEQLPRGFESEFGRLAAKLGQWPFLLGVVNGILLERVGRLNQTVSHAIEYVTKALEKKGLTAFDPANPAERKEAVGLVVQASLKLLNENDRRRLLELSIFPEDLDIPLDTIEQLWHATGGLDSVDTEQLCTNFYQHSLVLRLDLAARQMRLHDVMRMYLRSELLTCVVPKDLHAVLLDAWGDPLHLPDAYAWHWCAWHLRQAERVPELRNLLLTFGWLQAKLDATNVISLLTDYDIEASAYSSTVDRHQGSPHVSVQNAIRLSAHVLELDPRQLASQLIGRLAGLADDSRSLERDAIANLLDEAAHQHCGFWLRPQTTSLAAPGGPLVRFMSADGKAVLTVTAMPDGDRVISGSSDGTLRIWNWKSGRELRRLGNHTDWVHTVAVTPDGKRAISGAADNTLKFWDLENGCEIWHVDCPVAEWNDDDSRGPLALAVMPDGKQAISVSAADTPHLWNLADGKELGTVTGKVEWSHAVAITPDGTRLILGIPEGVIVLWDMQNGHELRRLDGHTNVVTALAVTSDGKRAVSASWDFTLRVWDLDSGQQIRVLEGHEDMVDSLAITPDGKRVVSGSYDNSIRIWQLDDGRQVGRFATPERVHGIAVEPEGHFVISASQDGKLRVWDLRRELIHEPSGHADKVTALAITSDGNIAISASFDKTVRVWDIQGTNEKARLEGHEFWVTSLAVTSDGKRAISGCPHHSARVWDLERCQEICQIPSLEGVGEMAAIPNSDQVLAVSEATWADELGRFVVSPNTRLKIWDWHTMTQSDYLGDSKDQISSLTATPDGQYVVLSFSRQLEQGLRMLQMLHLKTRRVKWERQTSEAYCLAFTSDALCLILGAHDYLVFCDLASGRELFRLGGHCGRVLSVAVMPDGKHIVSGSTDNTVRVWDLIKRRQVAAFTCDGAVSACAVTPDGKVIIAGDELGRIHFLELKSK